MGSSRAARAWSAVATLPLWLNCMSGDSHEILGPPAFAGFRIDELGGFRIVDDF